MHTDIERARLNQVIYGTLLPPLLVVPVGLAAFYVIVVRFLALRGGSDEGFAGLAAGVAFVGTLLNLIPLFLLFLLGHLVTSIFVRFAPKDSYFLRGLAIQSVAFLLCAVAAIGLFFLTGVTIIPITR